MSINNFFCLIGICLIATLCWSCGGADAEALAWKAAKAKGSLEAIDSFQQQFPDNRYKKDIAKLRDGILWNIAKLNPREYHYQHYLKEFPQGKYKEEATEKIKGIPNASISLESLTSKTFVGTIRYENEQELDVLSLKFVSIDQTVDAVKFRASVHLSHDIRKELWGEIELPSFRMRFQEDEEAEFLLGLADGRAYLDGEEMLLESIDPSQYWILR